MKCVFFFFTCIKNRDMYINHNIFILPLRSGSCCKGTNVKYVSKAKVFWLSSYLTKFRFCVHVCMHACVCACVCVNRTMLFINLACIVKQITDAGLAPLKEIFTFSQRLFKKILLFVYSNLFSPFVLFVSSLDYFSTFMRHSVLRTP